MLATMRNDTWNVLNMKPQIWEVCIIQTPSLKRLNDTPTCLKVITPVEDPNHHPIMGSHIVHLCAEWKQH